MANHLRITIVGDAGVGKSTVGFVSELNVDGIQYSLEFIEAEGQSLSAESEASDAFILVYSIDSAPSFHLLPSYLHAIRKTRSNDEDKVSNEDCTPENTPFPFMVLANKCDKPVEERAVPTLDGLTFARSAGGLFFECSAINRENIESSLETLVRSTIRSKQAGVDYKMRTGSVAGFNGNISLVERPSVRIDDEAAVQDQEEVSTFKRNPNLSLDRKKTQSRGGLAAGGRDESSGCCGGCVIV